MGLEGVAADTLKEPAFMDRRFKAIEKSNKVTQSALLALMKHALNDGDKSTLKDAEKQLEEYLIDKDM